MSNEDNRVDVARTSTEQELRFLVDTIPTLVWTAGPEGDIKYVNKRVLEYLGSTLDDIIGNGWVEKVHPDDIAFKVKPWLKALESEDPHDAVCRIRGADGRYRWFEVRGEPRRASDGTVLAWYGVLIDIDDRRKAEDARRENEDKLRQIIDPGPSLTWSMGSDGSEGKKAEIQPVFLAQVQAILNVLPAYTWYGNPSGSLLFVNNRQADFLGVPKDHPLRFGIDIGAQWDDWIPFLHPDEQEEGRKYWSNCLCTGEGAEHNYRVRDAQGNYHWFLTRAEPLRARDGTLLLWIGVTLDIEELKRAEEGLRESEYKLRQIIETIPSLVWSADPDFEATHFNKRHLDYYGMQLEDFKRGGWKAFQHPDDLPETVKAISQAVQTGTSFQAVHRIRRADGEFRWHDSRGEPLRDQQGRIIQWYGLTIDIDERKKAEEQLRRSEAYLAEAQRLSHTGTWVLNPRTMQYLYWSDESYRVWGFDPLQGPPSREALWQRIQDRDMVWEKVQEALRQKKDYSGEFKIVLPNGTVKYLAATSHHLFSSNGELVEVIGTNVDVTERKCAEQALRESEAKIRRLVDANIIGIFIWDFDGRILEANEAFLDILGYDHEDLVAGSIRWTDLTPPEWRDRDTRLIQEHKVTGTLQPFEKEYFRKDGSRVPVLIGVATFEEGGTQGVAFVLDLTERKRAEEALRRSEAYLAEAQRLSHCGVASYNETTILYGSEEIYRIWGFDPAQGVPSREAVFQRIHPDDRDRLNVEVQRAVGEKRRYSTGYRIVLPDGTVKHLEVIGQPMFSASGELVEIVTTQIDVTERKRAEERLRVQHTVAQILAEVATIEEATPRILLAMGECLGWDVGVLWSVDREADALRCVELWHKASIKVPEFERVSREFTFGPGVGLPGRVWSGLEPEYIPDVVPDENFLRAPIAEREGLRAAFGFPILLGGEVLGVIEFFSREIRQPDQELLNVLATIGSQIGQFIERKRAEEALHESERSARSAIDGIAGLIAIIAPSGELETVNRQCLDYFGQSLEWLKNWGTNDAVHPEDLPHLIEIFTRSIASGIPYHIDQRLRRFDGEYRWFDSRGVPVRDDSGRIARWYILLTDIEDRTRALARLEQMQSDFAHMNRVSMMGELAASLSHEITQPIAAARNYARAALNFLDQQPPDLGEVKKQLGSVVSAADRSGEIIGRIRDHIQKAPPRKARFDLNRAIDEVIALARSAITRNGVSVQTLLVEGLAPVQGDRVQLQQVVLNLVLNAVEAMGSVEAGPRELLISTEQTQAKEVLVAVRDSGPGIDPENLERVFETFYTTKTSGMGMGLSICRSIIDTHGGRLWAGENDPRGAVFQFTLPDAEEEILDPRPEAPHSRKRNEDSASDAVHPPAYEDNKRPHRSGRVTVQRRSGGQ